MFKRCWALEKVHGCFISRTNVRMVDGSLKYISKIKKGDEVLGVDQYGRIVPAKVTDSFINGKTNTWLTIKGTRSAAGQGPANFSIHCTPNHKFWNPTQNKYIAVKDLKVGDTVSVLRNDRKLGPLQYSVILGKLLGDGYLQINTNTASLQWGHSQEDA